MKASGVVDPCIKVVQCHLFRRVISWYVHGHVQALFRSVYFACVLRVRLLAGNIDFVFTPDRYVRIGSKDVCTDRCCGAHSLVKQLYLFAGAYEQEV